jgi:hypothetical protein
VAIPGAGSKLLRKGLQRKARRICISKSEDLQRKARFFAVWEFAAQIPKPQKMRPNSKGFLNWLLDFSGFVVKKFRGSG